MPTRAFVFLFAATATVLAQTDPAGVRAQFAISRLSGMDSLSIQAIGSTPDGCI